MIRQCGDDFTGQMTRPTVS